MTRIADAAQDFLACRRIAVTGVSREPKEHGGNIVYKRLRERGYDVFAVNPNATTLEGDTAYPDLRSIPGGVEAVVVATRPDRAEATVREAAVASLRQHGRPAGRGGQGRGRRWVHHGTGSRHATRLGHPRSRRARGGGGQERERQSGGQDAHGVGPQGRTYPE